VSATTVTFSIKLTADEVAAVLDMADELEAEVGALVSGAFWVVSAVAGATDGDGTTYTVTVAFASADDAATFQTAVTCFINGDLTCDVQLSGDLLTSLDSTAAVTAASQSLTFVNCDGGVVVGSTCSSASSTASDNNAQNDLYGNSANSQKVGVVVVGVVTAVTILLGS